MVTLFLPVKIAKKYKKKILMPSINREKVNFARYNNVEM